VHLRQTPPDDTRRDNGGRSGGWGTIGMAGGPTLGPPLGVFGMAGEPTLGPPLGVFGIAGGSTIGLSRKLDAGFVGLTIRLFGARMLRKPPPPSFLSLSPVNRRLPRGQKFIEHGAHGLWGSFCCFCGFSGRLLTRVLGLPCVGGVFIGRHSVVCGTRPRGWKRARRGSWVELQAKKVPRLLFRCRCRLTFPLRGVDGDSDRAGDISIVECIGLSRRN